MLVSPSSAGIAPADRHAKPGKIRAFNSLPKTQCTSAHLLLAVRQRLTVDVLPPRLVTSKSFGVCSSTRPAATVGELVMPPLNTWSPAHRNRRVVFKRSLVDQLSGRTSGSAKGHHARRKGH
jgi:hypothetical protein